MTHGSTATNGNRFEIAIKPTKTSSLIALIASLGEYRAHLARAKNRSRMALQISLDGSYTVVGTEPSYREQIIAMIQKTGFEVPVAGHPSPREMCTAVL